MYCPKCGRQVDNDAKFCPDCGTAINNKMSSNDIRNDKSINYSTDMLNQAPKQNNYQQNANSTIYNNSVSTEKNDGMCIASLVLGLVGVSVLSIIFGIIGLNNVSKNGSKGKGFAIAGITLGGIEILVYLISFIVKIIGAVSI